MKLIPTSERANYNIKSSSRSARRLNDLVKDKKEQEYIQLEATKQFGDFLKPM